MEILNFNFIVTCMQNDCTYIHSKLKTMLHFRTINSRTGLSYFIFDKYKCFGVACNWNTFLCLNEYLWFFGTIFLFHLDILEHVVWMKLQIEWIYILCSIGNVFKICDINFLFTWDFILLQIKLLCLDWYCRSLSICRCVYMYTCFPVWFIKL